MYLMMMETAFLHVKQQQKREQKLNSLKHKQWLQTIQCSIYHLVLKCICTQDSNKHALNENNENPSVTKFRKVVKFSVFQLYHGESISPPVFLTA